MIIQRLAFAPFATRPVRGAFRALTLTEVCHRSVFPLDAAMLSRKFSGLGVLRSSYTALALLVEMVHASEGSLRRCPCRWFARFLRFAFHRRSSAATTLGHAFVSDPLLRQLLGCWRCRRAQFKAFLNEVVCALVGKRGPESHVTANYAEGNLCSSKSGAVVSWLGAVLAQFLDVFGRLVFEFINKVSHAQVLSFIRSIKACRSLRSKYQWACLSPLPILITGSSPLNTAPRSVEYGIPVSSAAFLAEINRGNGLSFGFFIPGIYIHQMPGIVNVSEAFL